VVDGQRSLAGELEKKQLGVMNIKEVSQILARRGIQLECGDVLTLAQRWPAPTCIIVDGPYGLRRFPGDLASPADLPEWYRPHIALWTERARPDTTLWFWGTEIGWALVHPLLETSDWQYAECHIWDKGLGHIAGKCNSQTRRSVPVVTEVAVRYTRRNFLPDMEGNKVELKAWLRGEWERSGLPLSRANEACGVSNAATRKYLTTGRMWYFPPGEAVVRLAEYCHKYGRPTTRPYFSLDGVSPVTAEAWEQMRAKWHHIHGVTNVWREPPLRGAERMRNTGKYIHATQKPVHFMERQIQWSTDPGDVVWEPFGGLCPASLAALRTGRRACAAEINPYYFQIALWRLLSESGCSPEISTSNSVRKQGIKQLGRHRARESGQKRLW
jgi:site-specific DNA-methyltransferase (adenine-specific)